MRMLERHLTEVVRQLLWIFGPSILYVSVFKFCVIGGLFLAWFADSVLFTIMIKTEYEDGVDTTQDLIDRDMYLGVI